MFERAEFAPLEVDFIAFLKSRDILATLPVGTKVVVLSTEEVHEREKADWTTPGKIVVYYGYHNVLSHDEAATKFQADLPLHNPHSPNSNPWWQLISHAAIAAVEHFKL